MSEYHSCKIKALLPITKILEKKEPNEGGGHVLFVKNKENYIKLKKMIFCKRIVYGDVYRE